MNIPSSGGSWRALKGTQMIEDKGGKSRQVREIAIHRNVSSPECLRARHTAYGDAPNNVQQISKYKIMVRNHGHGHINHLIIISYHIVSCHHGHRHIINKDSCLYREVRVREKEIKR